LLRFGAARAKKSVIDVRLAAAVAGGSFLLPAAAAPSEAVGGGTMTVRADEGTRTLVGRTRRRRASNMHEAAIEVFERRRVCVLLFFLEGCFARSFER
jgi:hypothetical protein